MGSPVLVDGVDLRVDAAPWNTSPGSVFLTSMHPEPDYSGQANSAQPSAAMRSQFGEMVRLAEAPCRGNVPPGASPGQTTVAERHPTFRRLHLEIFSAWLVQTPEQQWDDFCLYLESPLQTITGAQDDAVLLSRMIPKGAEHVEQRLFEADCGLLGFAMRSACTDQRLMRLISAVKKRKGEIGLSLKELSPEVRLSARHVSRLCRESTGVAFQRYLRTVRMVNALALLRHSAYSVKEVASALGYGDSSNFCNEFRAEFDLSPARYRNERTAFDRPFY